MSNDKKSSASRHNQHNFAKALPAFDKAMRQIAEVPKSEVDKREHAERAARAAKK